MDTEPNKISVTLYDDACKALKEMADTEHRSCSNLVEVLVLEEAERRNPRPDKKGRRLDVRG